MYASSQSSSQSKSWAAMRSQSVAYRSQLAPQSSQLPSLQIGQLPPASGAIRPTLSAYATSAHPYPSVLNTMPSQMSQSFTHRSMPAASQANSQPPHTTVVGAPDDSIKRLTLATSAFEQQVTRLQEQVSMSQRRVLEARGDVREHGSIARANLISTMDRLEMLLSNAAASQDDNSSPDSSMDDEDRGAAVPQRRRSRLANAQRGPQKRPRQ